MSLLLPRAVSAIVLVIILAMMPTKFLLPKRFLLKQAFRPKISTSKSFNSDLLPFNGTEPTDFLGSRFQFGVGPLGFILVAQFSAPNNDAVIRNVSVELMKWQETNREWIDGMIADYGGIIFRGLDIRDPYEFDQIVAQFHMANSNESTGVYLGTAPRKKVPGTRFVSWASEIPGTATIPVHLELCYSSNPPPRLYFFAQQPNKPPGGQTPLADFRQVWRDLPDSLKNKLLSRGLLYERRYFDDTRDGFKDPLQHKSWQAMFETTDRAKVESMARAEGYSPIWEEDGGLLLRHTAIIARQHEKTGDLYWNTHFNVLHATTALAPLAYSAQIIEDIRAVLAYYALGWLMYFRHSLLGVPFGHDMVYADDLSALSFDEAMTIRQVISRQTWIFDWKAGDLLALDNHRTAHGRMPFYDSRREIFVAWH